ncbi:uncharacterized protein BO96DRAFT_468280 [Aspergillus niger CBS 101883]|uniref:uncharacterized protein n=1 Tax=Aspergillus lacticoffeatus (strain CBS 101883) TaxID=1450533 RepID=UPI000D80585F|nr:uncharacterized protein BO96DRAFT_468280 [Aspergillus niger CBS 101883]PYH53837.1 hypothetical protein BO96DRAFT_468280 [Aspergillus niger CBS 101883]
MIPCKSRSDARYLTHRLPSQIDFLAQDLAGGNEALILSSHAVHTVSTLLAQRCQDRSDCDDCIRNAQRQMWLSLTKYYYYDSGLYSHSVRHTWLLQSGAIGGAGLFLFFCRMLSSTIGKRV